MALPSFSRNYGRSGAYENPVTVVDTKTAEIWANTITNLGNQAAARLAEQQKAEAARIKELQDKIAFGYKQRKENTKVVYDALGVNGLNNPYLTDFASNKIDSLTQLDLDMYKQADPKALGEYNKKYDKEFQSIQNMKMTIGAMKESDAYFQEMMVDDTQILSVGRAGGIAAYDSKDEQWLLGHMVRAGLGDGAVERFYDDEDGVMMVEYKGGIAGEGFTAVAADFFNYIPGTVPDDSKDLQKRFKDKNLLTENGTINPAYRVKENNEDVLKSSIDPATQSLIVYSPLNTDQIKGVATITTEQLAANRLLTNDAQNSYTQNIRPFLVGKNISYKDGQQWPEELTFGNGTSGKSFYDNESQKLYRQALATYAENLFGLNKTNQEVSKTKLTDSEYKRRMGIVDEDKDKDVDKPASPEQRAKERAEDIVNALLKNPASTIREKLGPEAEFSTEGSVITIVRESGPESFDMNRKEDIKNLARELDKYQYGADATTDITSMEIGKFVEERRKKRLP